MTHDNRVLNKMFNIILKRITVGYVISYNCAYVLNAILTFYVSS